MQTITVNLRKQLFIASSKDVLNLVAQYVLCSPASRICGETRSTEGNNKKIVGTERSSDDAGTSGWMPQKRHYQAMHIPGPGGGQPERLGYRWLTV